MNQDELEKIKKSSFKKYCKVNDYKELVTIKYDFSSGFDAGVEALQKELDEAVELINSGSVHLDTIYENEGVNGECADWILKSNKFLAKVKRG